VLSIAVVSFERGRICAQRILWDHATLMAQLGVPSPVAPEVRPSEVREAGSSATPA
jgi:hypothetical protein